MAVLLYVLFALASSLNTAVASQRIEQDARIRRRSLSSVLPIVDSVMHNIESVEAKLTAVKAQFGSTAGAAGVLMDVKEMVSVLREP